MHRQKRGDHKGQQVWEALAVLVALRLWMKTWLHRKAALSIKSDNKAALGVAARLKTAKNANLIGREIAWIYTSAAFHPRYVRHAPGVTNKLADALSRLTDPNGSYEVPSALTGIAPSRVPLRPRSWYRTLAAEHVG